MAPSRKSAAIDPSTWLLPPFPRARRPFWKIAVLAAMVIVISVAMIGVYLSTTSLIGSHCSCAPRIVFTTPQSTLDGFSFAVASVEWNGSAASYKVALRVNGSSPYPVTLSTSPSTFVVNGANYSMTWTDTDGGGKLSQGDRFTVGHAGGLPPNSDYRFVLIWATSGIEVNAAIYHSP